MPSDLGIRDIPLRLSCRLSCALRSERLPERFTTTREQGAGRNVTDAECGRELQAGQIVNLGHQESRSLTLRNACHGPLKGTGQLDIERNPLGRRRRAGRFSGEWDKSHDLSTTNVVERHAMGDLVEPCPRIFVLLKRVIRLVGLDEGVLSKIRGEFRISKHAHEVREDLALMSGEERLNKCSRRSAVPRFAHGSVRLRPPG